jgi:transposase InsO family protein
MRVLSILTTVLRSACALFRTPQEQAVVELALRQQLAVYAQRHPRPRLSSLDRAFWVALSRLWPRWRNVLVLVKPETVVRWHREGFRRYWRSISTSGPGRPPISDETRRLIIRMATENPWRARKIQAELAKLGIRVSLATVSRYLPKVEPGSDEHQRWMTFLRNHRDLIAGMDFFVVPTARFHLLYVWFAIDHGRRRILHFNVTGNPTACWVTQQLRDAFPDEPAHRFLIFDNAAIFSASVTRTIEGFGIDPKRTAFRSPWQNGTAERFVGSVRRELLDHVVVLHEDHLRRLLREYASTTTPSASTLRSAMRPPGEPTTRGPPIAPGPSDSLAWADFTIGMSGAKLAGGGRSCLAAPHLRPHSATELDLGDALLDVGDLLAMSRPEYLDPLLRILDALTSSALAHYRQTSCVG